MNSHVVRKTWVDHVPEVYALSGCCTKILCYLRISHFQNRIELESVDTALPQCDKLQGMNSLPRRELIIDTTWSVCHV